MNRLDLFVFIHKGIRRILFDTTLKVAATDFSAGGEGILAAEARARRLGFLESHATDEDAIILPEISELAPELYIDLRAEHARLEGLQSEIHGIVERLRTANEPEAVSLGRRLSERLCSLTSLQLNHMAREETEVNRVLWAHRTDPQLQLLRERILDRNTPEQLAEWYALSLPAMNALERRILLSGLQAAMTQEQFERTTASARAALGERKWLAALTALA